MLGVAAHMALEVYICILLLLDYYGKLASLPQALCLIPPQAVYSGDVTILRHF